MFKHNYLSISLYIYMSIYIYICILYPPIYIYIYKCTSECHSQTTPILGEEIARARPGILKFGLVNIYIYIYIYMAHRQNVASLSLFYRYYFGSCSSELAQLVPLPYSRGRSTRCSDGCMIFLSPFPNITRMSMSTVSFLAQVELFL